MTRLAKTPFLVFAACMIFAGTLSASEQAGSPQPEARALTVQEAVRLTLSRSPEVLVAEAQAARAREALRESRSANLPRLFAGTGLAYNNGYPLSIEGAAPSIFQLVCKPTRLQQNKRQPDPRSGRSPERPGQSGSGDRPQ